MRNPAQPNTSAAASSSSPPSDQSKEHHDLTEVVSTPPTGQAATSLAAAAAFEKVPSPVPRGKAGSEEAKGGASADIAAPSALGPEPSSSSLRSITHGEAATKKISNALSKLSLPVSPEGLHDSDVERLREQYGYNEVLAKQTPEYLKILKRYFSVIPLILFIAAILSVAITGSDGRRDWLSFGLLLFLLNVMVWADYISDHNARNAIKAVEKLAAPSCRAKRNGQYLSIPVRELLPGDVVLLKAGIVIPADGTVIGQGEPLGVDESSLTGESLPVTKRPGDELLSGAVIQKGEMEMLVTKTGPESFYGKTLALLGEAESPGHLRIVLDKAAFVITSIATVFAIFLFFWFIFKTKLKWYISLKLGFVIVASVAPAAMPVITTTVLAVGAVMLSKEKAVVSRLSSIEEAAGMQVLCSDKTGTLTKNVLTLWREEIVCEPGVEADFLLLMASLAGSVEDPEPIDRAINDAANMGQRAQYTVLKYIPFNPVDKRTLAMVRYPDGNTLTRICKGAPHVVRDMVCRGNVGEMERLDKIINAKAERGLRTLGVAVQDFPPGIGVEALEAHDDGWQLLGYISLFDPPREDTADTISKARAMGIDVKMITGDQQAIAIETARQLQLGTNIVGPEVWNMSRDGPFLGQKSFTDFVLSVNGFAGVYPEHKFNVVHSLLNSGKLVGMTGDGVNDAPALKLATVGIAVAGATEAAKSAADIILLEGGLSPIITAFKLSRKIFRRVEAYIIFRIYTSILILLFYWLTVVFFTYQFPTWTLVLVSMINDFTLMSTARDRVPSPSLPQIWDMTRVCVIALWMSVLAVASMIFYLALIHPKYINWWDGWGIEEFPPTEADSYVSAALWLLLTLLIQTTFHSARTKGVFCHYDGQQACFPSILVILPQLGSIILTLFLSVYWPKDYKLGSGQPMSGITWGQAAVTVFWAALWFIIIDILKVLAYRVTSMHWEEFNILNVFRKRTKEEEEADKMLRLDDMRREELRRRFEDQEVTVTEKVEDHKAFLDRQMSKESVALDRQTRSVAGTVMRSSPGAAAASKYQFEQQNAKIASLEARVAFLEQQLSKLLPPEAKGTAA